MSFLKKLSQGRNPRIPLLRQVTQRVVKVGGINLGQGTCQLPVPSEVLEAATRAILGGHNRYTLAEGTLDARRAIANKLRAFNKITVDPENEIIVTPGVTGAFEALCCSMLDPGDEVVCFEPFYPYHQNTLQRFGAKIRYIKLVPPEWGFSLEDIEAAFVRSPKFVLLNTPSNPTGKVFSEKEVRSIGELAKKYDVIIVTDEMYEYMVYDGRTHVSPAAIDVCADRTVTMGGYSKTFAATGWRIGYAAGPAEILKVMTRVVDEVYICTPAPAQSAIAHALSTLPESFYAKLGFEYARKRDFFCSALRDAGFELYEPQGAYYIIADFEKSFGRLDSTDFVYRMVDTVGVGAVPSGDFVEDPSRAYWVRFCFAVEDSVLEQAAKRLCELQQNWGNVDYSSAA